LLKVSIRLTGEKESAYLVANCLNLKLDWKEYPVYDDRGQPQKEQVRLYATVTEKNLHKFLERQSPPESHSLTEFFPTPEKAGSACHWFSSQSCAYCRNA
jgi:hypothetical protein